MKTLYELWYGNLQHRDRPIRRGSQYDKALRLAAENQEELTNTLSDSQMKLFMRYEEMSNEFIDIREREAFTQGFCLAAKIMIDVMETMEVPSVDD